MNSVKLPDNDFFEKASDHTVARLYRENVKAPAKDDDHEGIISGLVSVFGWLADKFVLSHININHRHVGTALGELSDFFHAKASDAEDKAAADGAKEDAS